MPTLRLDDGTEIPLDEFESLILSWAICNAHDMAEKHPGLDQEDFDALTSIRDKLRDANFGQYFRNGERSNATAKPDTEYCISALYHDPDDEHPLITENIGADTVPKRLTEIFRDLRCGETLVITATVHE